MVIINIYGQIKPICVSEKLKLYISNLPKDKQNDWNSALVEELTYASEYEKLQQKRYKLNSTTTIKDLPIRLFQSNEVSKSMTDYAQIHDIVDNMICVYFDYSYTDMPLGGWAENPFDGRLCEKDYAELIVDFWNKTSFGQMPNWVYSSNFDSAVPYYRLFMPKYDLSSSITNLIKWGKYVDNFLQTRNDYLEFDYLVRSIYNNDENTANQFLKWYSLCQLFLEKDKEQELDWKLPFFLDHKYPEEKRKVIAKIFRLMRNKIAHGDFYKFEELIEEFAQTTMDGNFSFDYSEMSRKNWAISYAILLLSNSVKQMINLLFTNRMILDKIKNKKIDN